MPIRFPTEAANDPDVGDEGAPRGRTGETPKPRDRGPGASRSDAPKPGQDINQSGFIRDRDRDPDRER